MFEQPRGRPFKPGQSGNPALIQIRVQIGIPLALFDTTSRIVRFVEAKP